MIEVSIICHASSNETSSDGREEVKSFIVRRKSSSWPKFVKRVPESKGYGLKLILF